VKIVAVKEKNIKVPIEDAEYYLLSMTYIDEKTGEETTGNVRVINNKFVFEGDAEQSAKVFFDVILKQQVDDYLKVRAEYTEKPYIKLIKDECFSSDEEGNESRADNILLRLLKENGYDKLADLWCAIGRGND